MARKMTIDVKTSKGSYPVYTGEGLLERADEFIAPGRRAFILTDDGVPEKWTELLRNRLPGSVFCRIPQGEASKSIRTYEAVLREMLSAEISRNDTLVAIGGGVIGDLGGFAAASYMRGIRFVNVPTTTLSQIDSGIGGKTAINLGGVKNCVGAFWQPSAVIADTEVLKTLPKRHYSNGLAEAVKAGIIRDPELFALFEEDSPENRIEEIIMRSLLVKKTIVEEDELEKGSRRLLNFGHTLGHAFEAASGLGEYLHGECVAMGMMAILENAELKERLGRVLERLGLPLRFEGDRSKILDFIRKDKKADHGTVSIVQADEIGKAYIKTVRTEELWKEALQ